MLYFKSMESREAGDTKHHNVYHDPMEPLCPSSNFILNKLSPLIKAKKYFTKFTISTFFVEYNYQFIEMLSII